MKSEQNSDQEIATEDLLFAMQQRNLVYNYNFVFYSNQTNDTSIVYNHPDGWVYEDAGSGGEVGFDTGTNSCRVLTSSGDSLMVLSQMINEFPRWDTVLNGQKVTACAEVENPGTSSLELTFSLFDGTNTSSKTVQLDAGDTKEVLVDIVVNKTATQLGVSVSSTSDAAVILISEVYANLGEIALDTLACMVDGFIGERKQYMSTENPPAQELSLCQTSKALSSSYTRLSSFLYGKFGTGDNGLSLLPDMSGYFSRAWDNSAKIDPDAAGRSALGEGQVTGDNVGTVQQDQFKEHLHGLAFDTTGTVTAGTASAVPIISTIATSNTEKTGGNETRGVNISELYTMKWS